MFLLEHVYVWYDRPQVWRARGEDGVVYIGYWIEEYTDYLIPVSQQRLEDFENNNISLRGLVLASESKRVLRSRLFLYNNDLTEVIGSQFINISEIPKDDLPDEDSFIGRSK